MLCKTLKTQLKKVYFINVCKKTYTKHILEYFMNINGKRFVNVEHFQKIFDKYHTNIYDLCAIISSV